MSNEMSEKASINSPMNRLAWYILFFLRKKKYDRIRPCITPRNIRKANKLISGSIFTKSEFNHISIKYIKIMVNNKEDI